MLEAIGIATDGTAGVHLSLDMDYVDPQYAPGVGTPVRGGATYRESAFGNGIDLRFGSHGLDGSGRGQSGD